MDGVRIPSSSICGESGVKCCSARLHSETLLLLIYLADEDHHPLLEAEQFIRHPLGLVQQSVGGVIVTIKSSLQIDQGFHPRLHQHQDRVKQPFILHKTHRRRERAHATNNPMFNDLFLFYFLFLKKRVWYTGTTFRTSSPVQKKHLLLSCENDLLDLSDLRNMNTLTDNRPHLYINKACLVFRNHPTKSPRWVLIPKHQKTIYIIPVCMQLTKADYVSLTLKVWCTFQDFICSHFNADQGFIIN